jgi:hypothetical protein
VACVQIQGKEYRNPRGEFSPWERSTFGLEGRLDPERK